MGAREGRHRDEERLKIKMKLIYCVEVKVIVTFGAVVIKMAYGEWVLRNW